MSTFSTNEKALEEITRIISESGCGDPVVTLSDTAPVDVSDATKSAFLADMDRKEARAMAAKINVMFPDKALAYSLTVGVYERKECRPEDLIDVNGITFAMATYLRDALREYCLTFEDGHFSLQSSDDAANSLRSVKTIAKWFT